MNKSFEIIEKFDIICSINNVVDTDYSNQSPVGQLNHFLKTKTHSYSDCKIVKIINKKNIIQSYYTKWCNQYIGCKQKHKFYISYVSLWLLCVSFFMYVRSLTVLFEIIIRNSPTFIFFALPTSKCKKVHR